MNIARFGVSLVATIFFSASAAVAADEGNGAAQIIKGDYAAAERIILAQEKMFPGDPDLLLNLGVGLSPHRPRERRTRFIPRGLGPARRDDGLGRLRTAPDIALSCQRSPWQHGHDATQRQVTAKVVYLGVPSCAKAVAG